MDGKQVNSCHVLLSQVEGCCIQTAEGLGETAEQGWKSWTGCTPCSRRSSSSAQCSAAIARPLCSWQPRNCWRRRAAAAPSHSRSPKAEAREALSGVLASLHRYVKPVAAVLKAARGGCAGMNRRAWRRHHRTGLHPGRTAHGGSAGTEPSAASTWTRTDAPSVVVIAAPGDGLQVVGKSSSPEADAAKLALGKPALTVDDLEMRGMLIGKIMHSLRWRTHQVHRQSGQALALPGVAAVLTHMDIPCGALHRGTDASCRRLWILSPRQGASSAIVSR